MQARDHAARAEHEGKEEYITLGSCTRRFVTLGLFVEMTATAGAARRERGVPSAIDEPSNGRGMGLTS